MATLGDVVVNLRANTADFRRAIQESARDVQQLKADVASGKITLQQYGESMAAVRDRLAGFRDQVGNLGNKELAQFNRVMQATAPAAERAGVGLRALRGPLATLAADAVGVNSSFGALGSALVSIAGGTGVGLGVVAAIGAIGLAMKTFRDTTEDARKSYEDWLDSLRKKTPLAIIGARKDLAEFEVQRLRTVAAGDVQLFGFIKPETIQKLSAARKELAGLQAQYDQLFKGLKGNSHEKFNEDLEKSWKSARTFNDTLADLNKSLDEQLRLRKAILDANDPTKLLTMSSLGFGPRPDPANYVAAKKGIIDPEQIMRGVKEALAGIDPESLIPKALKQQGRWREIGDQLGNTIGNGIARGIGDAVFEKGKSIGNILKSVFREIFETILREVVDAFAKRIGKAIGNALAGGGGGGGGLFSTITSGLGLFFGGGLFSRAAEPGGGTVIVPVSMIPPNPSPIAMARDAQHLALWAETERVARSMGIRLSVR